MPANESIKDYDVYSQLGKGGFAQVYLAKVKQTQQDVAIKMIDKKKMKAARMVTRVKEEVAIHSRLKHPSILELYSFFEDEHYVYLVLELCEKGEMLHHLKTRTPLNEDEARHFLKQIVDGMIYLHSHNILHRDLTLSNLLLTRDMNIKISDFGLATQINDDKKHMTMCGTPNFISPEIVERKGHGLEADVWSLGCMMFTFLTGKPPFDTEGIRNTLNKVMQGEFAMPQHITVEAQDLIRCLLQKNPHDRIPLTKVLEHPFMTKGHLSSQPHCTSTSSSQSHNSNSSSSSSSMSRASHVTTPAATTVSTSGSFRPPVISFNESIDSGRGTMTTATTTANTNLSGSTQRYMYGHVTPPNNLANLCTLQSGQEEDFSAPTNTSSNSTSLKSSKSEMIDHSGTSKNGLYYNRFINKHPPSPPIKLSSYSPTKLKQTAPQSGSSVSSSSNWSQRVAQYQQQQPVVTQKSIHELKKGAVSSLLDNTPPQSPLLTLSHHTASQYAMSAAKGLSQFSAVTSNKLDESSDGAQSLSELCSPIRTDRLRPMRQQNSKFVMTITEQGEVVFEFFKMKASKIKVVEVIRIGANGMKIVIYAPNAGKGFPLGDKPPLPPVDKGHYLEFDFNNLPQRYWKKYSYAARFVHLVRSKTSKITLFTKEAKCILTETSPDFEVTFNNGTKVLVTKEGTKITNPDGTNIMLDLSNNMRSTCLSPEMQIMLDQVNKWHQFCLEEESIHDKRQLIYDDIQVFPLIIGRRLANGQSSNTTSANLTNNGTSSSNEISCASSTAKSSTSMHSSRHTSAASQYAGVSSAIYHQQQYIAAAVNYSASPSAFSSRY